MRRLSRKYLKCKLWERYLKFRVHPPQDLFSLPGYLHLLEGKFLYWLGSQVPAQGLALEIGSFKGKSSCFVAAGLPLDAKLVCVDTWYNDAMPYDSQNDVLPEFLYNTAPYQERIEPNRGRSLDVASVWSRPLDFLFIDGDHSYEGCSTDLKAWLPFVKKGGWIAFHDSGEPGVARAIAERLPPACRESECQAWSIFAARKK